MDKELAVKYFLEVRDIPYRIPLAEGESDDCCSGKSIQLKDSLEKLGYTVRFRVCTFGWSSINLPVNVGEVPHKDLSTHSYLEVLINDSWRVVDPTWDRQIAKAFHINEWDGESATEIAVKPLEIISVEKSNVIMTSGESAVDDKDLKINGKFYEAFNIWLENLRSSS